MGKAWVTMETHLFAVDLVYTIRAFSTYTHGCFPFPTSILNSHPSLDEQVMVSLPFFVLHDIHRQSFKEPLFPKYDGTKLVELAVYIPI